MEYHPDKQRDNPIEANRIFKRIAEAYDVLTKPESNIKSNMSSNKYAEKANIAKNDILSKNKYDQQYPNIASLEDAFQQLIKGIYPSKQAKKRDLKQPKKFEDLNLQEPNQIFEKLNKFDLLKVRNVFIQTI